MASLQVPLDLGAPEWESLQKHHKTSMNRIQDKGPRLQNPRRKVGASTQSFDVCAPNLGPYPLPACWVEFEASVVGSHIEIECNGHIRIPDWGSILRARCFDLRHACEVNCKFAAEGYHAACLRRLISGPGEGTASVFLAPLSQASFWIGT